MKNILVLTDFSKNAAHAAESAVWFAEKLHAGLLLWNCYPKVPVMPGYLGGTLVAETLAGLTESKERLSDTVLKLEDFITDIGGDYKPRLLTRYREGSLKEELEKELSAEAFEMIVMGAGSDCAVDHIFTGSDSHKVIETANCPVLIVPPKAGLDQLDKVVFATDFELGDLNAIRYLDKLSHTLGFRIELVHITVIGDKNEATIEKETAFSRQLAELKYAGISYRAIRGKEVVSRLNRISKQTLADVLAMTHHQYTFFKRLISDSVAKNGLAHQRIPLLIFPLNERTS